MPQDSQGAQINFPEGGRGLGHVTPTFFGSTVGYPSDSLASCLYKFIRFHSEQQSRSQSVGLFTVPSSVLMLMIDLLCL